MSNPPLLPQTAPRSDLYYVVNDQSSFVHINDFLQEKRASNDEDLQTTVRKTNDMGSAGPKSAKPE